MAEPLASHWESRADEYDVVVIGSGYGGAITAARIASADIRPKPTVCILERGIEWIPGTFPDESADVLAHFLSPLNPLGLYEFSIHPDISVLQGSGLGGTSLVNANVAIIPEDAFFERTPWPPGIRMSTLRPYYQKAADTLEISEHPQGKNLRKVQALKKRADRNPDAKFELLKLAVNFTHDGLDPNGVERRPCIDCGDCVTGCNVRAKNTLYMNYLPIAKNHGAHIFTQVRVRYIVPAINGGYLIHYERYAPRHPIPESGVMRARRTVIVSAGALGSTEIMLRSREHGLSLPDAVATRFSGNGDFFGIAYNSDQRTDIMGFGNHLDEPDRSAVKAGPTIVGVIRYNRGKPLNRQMTIEDLTIPRAGVEPSRRTLPWLPGTDTDNRPILDWLDNVNEVRRVALDIQFNPEGALNHTMCYLVMADDPANGTMELKHDRLKIKWPNVGNQPIFQQINNELREHAKVLGAKFIQNPIWRFLPNSPLLTAHPLGGCPMGESHTTGFVDEFGKVFKSDGTKHGGLYVADGSVVPTALGVNPFLTISALCERIADHLVEELR
ncbi:GMC family oxidoreductase [Acidobacteriia bacterium AH_259_A11_L15]|nr:GMC family oxidoreductase [Acidobacteriia bacterium AH_259_A11_L15]